VKHGEGNTNSPELSLLKFLPLAYHHSHFLAATLDFTSFFTMAFLELHTLLQLGCFGLDSNFLCKTSHGVCNTDSLKKSSSAINLLLN